MSPTEHTRGHPHGQAHAHGHSHAPTAADDLLAASTSPSMEVFRALPCAALVARMKRGVECFDRRVLALPDAQLDMAFLPDAPGNLGRWPCRVLLGHVADADLAFVHRLRRVVGEDQPVFSMWDENAFIDAGLYGTDSPDNPGSKQPVAAFVATIHTLRQWTCEWLDTLPETAWSRRGLHPERGEQTLRRIAEYMTWHLEHHAWFLNRKVARLAG